VLPGRDLNLNQMLPTRLVEVRVPIKLNTPVRTAYVLRLRIAFADAHVPDPPPHPVGDCYEIQRRFVCRPGAKFFMLILSVHRSVDQDRRVFDQVSIVANVTTPAGKVPVE
jgi:hypothetical protein